MYTKTKEQDLGNNYDEELKSRLDRLRRDNRIRAIATGVGGLAAGAMLFFPIAYPQKTEQLTRSLINHVSPAAETQMEHDAATAPDVDPLTFSVEIEE